jgi:putative aldouronate transport system permease protein
MAEVSSIDSAVARQVAQTGADSRKKPFRVILAQHWQMYVMLIPALIFLILFRFLPIWGISIAFVDFNPFKGLLQSEFVGFENFLRFFRSRRAIPILYNTVFIAVGKIIIGQIMAIFFALLINEVRSRPYRRLTQTLTTLPHFMSWVIVGGIMVGVLSTPGIVNQAISAVGLPPVKFLGKPQIFPWTLIGLDTWKGFGWGAIIYLAALTNINPELYEAAAVDGAGRWRRILHITLPGIRTTIVLLSCLNLGNILNAGFEQILVLMNPVVERTGDIIDTYVYRVGLLRTDWSLGSAVGLLKSVIGFGLILLSYWLADKFANYRIF